MNDRVLVPDGLEEAGLEVLRAAGLAPDLRPGLSPAALADALQEGHAALVVRSASRVTRETLARAARLRIVARAGVGVDNIDVAAASERGVLVVNAPEGNTLAAAEHTMALMLALARKVPDAHAALRAGRWDRKPYMGVELYGKLLGVVGLGKIGRTVAARGKAFGMEVLGFDPFVSPDLAQSMGVTPASLDEILRRADFLTLHVPLTEETRGLLGAAAIERMKRSARIVNCARGGLVDEAALAEALRTGRLAGAALDVFADEPPRPDSPLLSAPGAVLTPHLGASTQEAQERVGVEVAQQVVEYLTSGVVRYAVNAPPMPPEVARALSPTMDLASRLGRLLAQLVRGSLREIHVEYRGEVTAHPTRPVTTALLTGFLGAVTDEPVNMVNAAVLVKQRGIAVNETTVAEDVQFARLVVVTFVTDRERRTVAGTLLGPANPRIVRLDGYDFDAVPSGHLLLVSNEDRAGVVGHLGTLMGKHDINIARMSLGRDAPSGLALAIINVDSAIPEAVLQEVACLPHVTWVKAVRL